MPGVDETQNGSEGAQGERKSWERPWTIDEMNNNAQNWSLAADVGLLKYLQEFAKHLTSKAHESSQNLNQLVHNTQVCKANVRIITDDFLTLSNSQFIENRVYDEDVTSKEEENKKEETEVSKTREEREKKIIPKINEAINWGIKVLDEAYDILDVRAADSDFDSSDDSDDAEQNGNARPGIYEPKDPYIHRPLPHLIGSRGFHQTDDVGIGEWMSDDEEEDQKDVTEGDSSDSDDSEPEIAPKKPESDSDSFSSSDYESDVSLSSDDNKKEIKNKTSKSPMFGTDNSDSSDNDLFNNSKQDNSDDFTSSDNDKPIAKQPSPKPGKKKVKKKPKQEDLFGNMEDEDDDNNDLFNASGGLFGSGSNLFTKSKQKKNKPKSDLFDDINVSDSPASEEEIDKQSPVPFSKENSRHSSFVSVDKNDSRTNSISKSETSTKSRSKSTPYGGVSLFGGAIDKNFFNPKKEEKSGSEEEFDQVKNTNQGKSSSLFNSSDSEDDLFKTAATAKPVKAVPKKETKKSKENVKPASLFDDVKTNKNEITAQVKKPTKGLFDSGSDSDENDLFSTIASAKPIKNETKSNTLTTGISNKAPSSTGKSSGLFSESSSDSDDLKPPPIKSSNLKKSSLFGDDSDSDDMFSTLKNESKPAKTSATNKKATEKPKVSVMFDSNDESDDDLFSSDPPKSSNKSKKAPVQTNKDLFDSSAENKSESDDEAPEPIKKKPMAGAVPMFMGALQGSELASAISRRRVDTSDSNKSVEVKKAETPTLFKPETDEKSTKEPSTLNTIKSKEVMDKVKDIPVKNNSNFLSNSSPKPFTTKQDVKSEPVEVNVSDNKLDKIENDNSNTKKLFKPSKFKLNIDPTHMLPGAAPKPRVFERPEVSFDKPPNFKTLESITKTRAKGQSNRRPPSRHRAAKKSDSGETDTRPKVSKNLDTSIDTNISTTKTISISTDDRNSIKSEIKPKVDNLFTLSDNKEVNDSKIKSDDSPVTEDDPVVENKESKTMFDDEDDDLFSMPTVTKPEKVKSKKVKMFDDDLFGEDDDDIFSVPKSDKDGKKSEKPTVMFEKDDLFADDDDIFGDLKISSGPPKSTTEKSAKQPSAKPKDDIFDEDIFGDDISFDSEKIASKPVPKTEKKKAVVPDDLFGDGDDEDDIFSSSSKSVKKEVTKTKPSKAKQVSASIFDDDIDDIFLSSSKPKKKSTKAKTTNKPAKTEVEDIFDDPLNAWN